MKIFERVGTEADALDVFSGCEARMSPRRRCSSADVALLLEQRARRVFVSQDNFGSRPPSCTNTVNKSAFSV
ncbi:MAG: hypothetical protein DI536_31150 [Archangium gephyra]|uniref:Uncharacterized protein n=1 Tax=Archangium gephyra TaxID=48 RepID=A0A2W5V760_9BACT|nr:MAG: hypothetical protein DI536_31150 [Archangium gephyra]